MNKDRKDLFCGCLVGGAVGDALGYFVEFLRWKEIEKKYGKEGIQDLDSDKGFRKAVISDDTQMTLFTAEGLLHGKNAEVPADGTIFDRYMPCIWDSYKDWYDTQRMSLEGYDGRSWLCTIPALNRRRAPGLTCLDALSNAEYTLSTDPVNNSKGCGGVMRVAPIGLYFNPEKLDSETPMDLIDMMGAEASAVTHGHPLGYIPSAAFVHMINRLVYPQNGPVNNLAEVVVEATEYVTELYGDKAEITLFHELMNRAVVLAGQEIADRDAIKKLGEGWVAEEALAVAVFSAVRYQDDFRKAIQCAVNHDGDSDSTGSIAGNILGAYLGYEGIRHSFKLKRLELLSVIKEMAGLLYQASL